MKLQLRPYSLRLRHTFTIARESHDDQPTLIVELEQDGRRGYGEATSNPYYGASVPEMTASLERVRPLIENYELGEPAELWNLLQTELGDQPFPLCAIDLAAYDLWGKLQSQPVYKLWGLSLEHLPLTNYTIGIDTIEKMVAKMQEFPNWPIYKIKLGTDHDIDIVRQLRQHTQSIFRVDANCGWSAAETIANSHALSELGVEFIEQPLPADQWDAMREVYAKSALPIMADESCIVESDIARCQGYFHGVNIKLVKCGGLTPARRMIDTAKQLGLKTMVGCMTESSVGISAIAQLLPLLDYVDMDGALLLAEDIATGVTIEQGRVSFPLEPGCGVRLRESL
jgi:L-Ala-D/L-Glu epimerase